MESCKQISWSEEVSLTQNNLQEEVKLCSMCGDVGLPHYLFKCLTCSHRYQHIYCSKFYPYRIAATDCNWCLPTGQLVNTTGKVEDDTSMKVGTNWIRDTMPDIETCSNFTIIPQLHTREKRTMAFECLLRVAELHDQRHLCDNSAACVIREADSKDGSFFSKRPYVDHSQNNGEGLNVGPNAKKILKQEPASLVMHHLIFSGCREDKLDQGLYASRGADRTEYASRPPTGLVHERHTHPHSPRRSPDQAGMSPDGKHPQTIKSILDEDLGHNQIRKKMSTNEDLGSNHQNFIAADEQRIHKQAANYNASSIANITDQGAWQSTSLSWQSVGEYVTRPPKRPRHGLLAARIHAGVLDSPTAQQWGDVAGDNDLVHIAAEDQHRVFSAKQGSPTHTPHAWTSSKVAGKRDHVMNSPSRAMKCRYKLLADVLC